MHRFTLDRDILNTCNKRKRQLKQRNEEFFSRGDFERFGNDWKLQNCRRERLNESVQVQNSNSLYLDNEFVWNRGDHLGFFAEELDGVGVSGLDVDALDVNEGAGLLRLGDSGVVGLDSVEEALAGLGVADVLDSEVHSLGDDSSVVLKKSLARLKRQKSTFLLTITPTAFRETLKTRPVVPW